MNSSWCRGEGMSHKLLFWLVDITHESLVGICPFWLRSEVEVFLLKRKSSIFHRNPIGKFCPKSNLYSGEARKKLCFWALNQIHSGWQSDPNGCLHGKHVFLCHRRDTSIPRDGSSSHLKEVLWLHHRHQWVILCLLTDWLVLLTLKEASERVFCYL